MYSFTYGRRFCLFFLEIECNCIKVLSSGVTKQALFCNYSGNLVSCIKRLMELCEGSNIMLSEELLKLRVLLESCYNS